MPPSDCPLGLITQPIFTATLLTSSVPGAAPTTVDLLTPRSPTLRERHTPITLEGIAEAAAAADIVFVDYLQLMQPDADQVGTGRVDELDAAMRSILAITQQGATVFAAAAMNRVGRDTASLGSIRGSSTIEYGATTVYAATESLAGIDPDADGPSRARISVEYRCVKQREGEAVPLRFDLALPLGPLPLGCEA